MTFRTTFLGLLLLVAGAARAATPPLPIDSGSVLFRLTPRQYILQTGDTLYELSEDDLEQQSFQADAITVITPERPIVETEHYEELGADGSITRHYTLPIDNQSDRAVVELRFGLAPWERSLVDRRRYRDDFGNELEARYDPPRARWEELPDARIQVTVPLVVPVAPGEKAVVHGTETGELEAVGEHRFAYRFRGDYAEHRLVWRKLRLPRGAEIVEVSPAPSARFTHDEHEYLIWRRFYRAHEEYPLSVVYSVD